MHQTGMLIPLLMLLLIPFYGNHRWVVHTSLPLSCAHNPTMSTATWAIKSPHAQAERRAWVAQPACTSDLVGILSVDLHFCEPYAHACCWNTNHAHCTWWSNRLQKIFTYRKLMSLGPLAITQLIVLGVSPPQTLWNWKAHSEKLQHGVKVVAVRWPHLVHSL